MQNPKIAHALQRRHSTSLMCSYKWSQWTEQEQFKYACVLDKPSQRVDKTTLMCLWDMEMREYILLDVKDVWIC